MKLKTKIKHKRAFTLIELLVVIAIIGVLATLSIIALNNARAKSRDAKRAADIKQMQTALELYFNDTGRYPTPAEFNSGSILSTTTNSTTTYMKIIPSAPTPADGNCAYDNAYYYESSDSSTYTLSYCLGSNLGSVTAGTKCANPGGVSNSYCGNPCANNTCSWQFVGGPDISEGMSTTTSLAVYNNTPYVAYSSSAYGGKAVVQKFNGTSWEYVGTPGISAGHVLLYSYNGVHLAIDNNDGTPYILYSESAGNYQLIVKKFNGSSWDDVGTVSSGTGAYNFGIKIYQGTPYIMYWQPSAGLIVKKFDGVNWVTLGSDVYGGVAGADPSFTVYNNIPYVAYTNQASPYEVVVKKFNGSSWDSVGPTGFFNSTSYGQTGIALKNNVIYVAYDNWDDVIKYENNTWSQIGDNLAGGYGYSMKFFADNKNVYMSFQNYWAYDYKATVLKYTGQGVSGWEIQGGLASDEVAYYIDSAINNNILYVSYIDSIGKVNIRKLAP